MSPKNRPFSDHLPRVCHAKMYETFQKILYERALKKQTNSGFSSVVALISFLLKEKKLLYFKIRERSK